ncbi:hypothetical protein VTI28DRAFT_5593 [Corynascus sepedonium]
MCAPWTESGWLCVLLRNSRATMVPISPSMVVGFATYHKYKLRPHSCLNVIAFMNSGRRSMLDVYWVMKGN